MRKVAFWFLIIALPFVGHFTGSLLIPELLPKWETCFPAYMIPLGLVDNGQTVLLAERNDAQKENRSFLEAIVGIDVITGKQLFRNPFPEELRQMNSTGARPAKLIGPEHHLLVFDSGCKDLLLFDWKKQEIIHRYRFQPKYLHVNEAIMRHNTVAAFAWNVDEGTSIACSYLVFWDADKEFPKFNVEVGQEAIYLYLSEDGAIAAILTETNKVEQLVLVDTKNGKVLQKISGWFQDIRWSADMQQMQIVESGKDGAFIQYYERQQDRFVPTAKVRVATSRVIANHTPKYFALHSFLGATPLRRKLQLAFNKPLNAILDLLWPITACASIHDPATGETLKSLSVPGKENLGTLLPTDNLDGVIISSNKSIAYWSFDTPSSWPKWAGLFLGVSLAVLLVFRNMNRRVARIS